MIMSIKTRLLSCAIVGATAAAGLTLAAPAQAGSDPILGQITPAGYTFCPRGTAEANGALLPINTNSALFSLFGTTYGGDGRTTFGLPDLRSRIPIHQGNGPGLSTYSWGQRTGVETTTASLANLASHTHRAAIRTLSGAPNTMSPVGATFSVTGGNAYNNSATPTGRFMNAGAVGVENTGLGQAQNNMQPYTTIRYCVTTQGLYPSRS